MLVSVPAWKRKSGEVVILEGVALEVFEWFTAIKSTEPACSPKGPGKRGHLSQMIMDLVKSSDGPFTVSSLIRAAQDSGYQFVAGRPTVVVGDIVRKLRDKGVVVVVGEHSGPHGTVYSLARKAGL